MPTLVVDLDSLSVAAGWLLKRVTIERVTESAGADAQELRGSLAMLIALGEWRADLRSGVTGGVGETRARTSRVCWAARSAWPAHRCDRRSPTPWTAHRGGSERFGPTNSFARIR